MHAMMTVSCITPAYILEDAVLQPNTALAESMFMMRACFMVLLIDKIQALLLYHWSEQHKQRSPCHVKDIQTGLDYYVYEDKQSDQ